MVAVYRQRDFIQAQTPGARDVLVFERATGPTGRSGTIAHFGFRLRKPAALSGVLKAARRAGGRIVETGEFCPGEPYAFVEDRDGHVVEIWYEIPTPVDPARRRRRGMSLPVSRRGG